MAGKKKDYESWESIFGPSEQDTKKPKNVNRWAALPQRTRDFQYITKFNNLKTKYSADDETTLEEFLANRRQKLQNRLKPTAYAIEMADKYATLSREEQTALQYDPQLGYVSVQEKNLEKDTSAITVSRFNNYNNQWATATPSIKRKALLQAAGLTQTGVNTEDVEFAKSLTNNPDFTLAVAMGVNNGAITKRQVKIINNAMDLLEISKVFVYSFSPDAKQAIVDSLKPQQVEALAGLLYAIKEQYESRTAASEEQGQNPIIGFLGATVGQVIEAATELNDLAQHLYRATAVTIEEGTVVSPITVMANWNKVQLGAIESKELKRLNETYGAKNVQVIRDVFVLINDEDGFAKLLQKYANDEEALYLFNQIMYEDTRTPEVTKLIEDYKTISRDDLGNIAANMLLPDDWRTQDSWLGGKIAWDFIDMGTNFAGVWFGDPLLIGGKAVKGYKIMKYGLIKDGGFADIEKVLGTPKVKRFVDNLAPRIDEFNSAENANVQKTLRANIKRDFGTYVTDDALNSMAQYFRETERVFETPTEAFGGWLREMNGIERLLMGRPVRAREFLAPRMTRSRQIIINRRLAKNKTINFNGSDDAFIKTIIDDVYDEASVRATFGLGPTDDISKLMDSPEFVSVMRQVEAKNLTEVFDNPQSREILSRRYGVDPSTLKFGRLDEMKSKLYTRGKKTFTTRGGKVKTLRPWSVSPSAWRRRTDEWLRNLENAPMKNAIKVADDSDADEVFNWARTTFSKTMSLYIRELWSYMGEGQRRVFLASMFESIADAKGIIGVNAIQKDARQKIVTSSTRSDEKYGTVVSITDEAPDGTQFSRTYDTSDFNGKQDALHPSQLAEYVSVPNFAELQLYSTKVTLLGKILGWTYGRNITELTSGWSTLNLAGPRYVQRASFEDVIGAALTGMKPSEMFIGKMVTQASLEARGLSTGVVGETTRKLGDIIQRKFKGKEQATQFASKEEEVKYIVEASNPNIKGNTEYIAMVKTDFIYSIREFNRLGIDAIYENSAKRIADITKDLEDGKGFIDELIVSYDPASHSALLIEGNHRIQAAINAGLDYVPVRITKAFKAEIEKGELIKLPGSAKVDYVGSSQNPFGILPDDVIAKSVDEITQTKAILGDATKVLNPVVAVGRQFAKLVKGHLNADEIIAAKKSLERGNTKDFSKLVSKAFLRMRVARLGNAAMQMFKRKGYRNADVERALDAFSSSPNFLRVGDEVAEFGRGDLNNFTVQQSASGGRIRKDLRPSIAPKPTEWENAITYASDPNVFVTQWYSKLHAFLHADGEMGQEVFKALATNIDDVQKARNIAIARVTDVLEANPALAERFSAIGRTSIEKFATQSVDDTLHYFLKSDGTLNKKLIESLTRFDEDGQMFGKLYLTKGNEITEEIDVDFLKRLVDADDAAKPSHVLGRVEIGMAGQQGGMLSRAQDWIWSNQSYSLGRNSRLPIFTARAITEYLDLEKLLLPIYKSKGLSDEAARKMLTDIAETRAEFLAVSYMDNPQIRSIGAYSVRNVARYYRATEDFFRRVTRATKFNAESIQKLNILYGSLQETGFTWKDENGESYFMYPGTGALHKAVATVYNMLPYADVYTVSPYSFGGNLSMLTPSADPDAWMPTFSSPISGLMTKALTSLGPFEELESWLLGPKGTKKAGSVPEEIKEYLDAVLPSHLKRAFNLLDFDDRESQYASAVRGAIQVLAFNGELDDVKTESQRKEIFDKIERTAFGNLVTKFILGFMVPASPQMIQNQGISDELRALGVPDLRQGFIQLLNKYDGDYEKANAVWYKLNPDLFPFTVSSSGNVIGGAPAATLKSLDWLNENEQFTKKYMQAAIFLSPSGGNFSMKAYGLVRALGYTQPKATREYFVDAITAGDKYMYYLSKESYEKDREQALTSYERNQIDERWKEIKNQMIARNPWLEEVVMPDSLGEVAKLRKDALSEMRLAIADIYENNSVPRSKASDKIYTMLGTFDSGMRDLEKYSGGNSAYFTYNRERVRTRLMGILENVAGKNEGATNFYERILKPLIEG
jgi:hypothetical protein